MAGIVGTLWQGKRAREAAAGDLRQSLDTGSKNLLTSIGAENERVRIAEKRRIYAHFIATLGELLKTWNQVNTRDRAEALTGALAAVAELRLIAPNDLGSQAESVLTFTAAPGPVSSDWAMVRLLLINAMRADLGEADPLSPAQRDKLAELLQPAQPATLNEAPASQDHLT
jgi:hypothetical protein